MTHICPETDWKNEGRNNLSKRNIRTNYNPHKVVASVKKNESYSNRTAMFNLAMRVFNQMKDSLMRLEGKGEHPRSYFKPPEGPDRVLILNLRVWMFRYKISMDYIMKELMSYYRNARRRIPDRSIVNLGLPIRTLCSESSRTVIGAAVARDFPGRENIKSYVSDLIASAAFKSPTVTGVGNLTEMTDEYVRKIKVRRNLLIKASAIAIRRPWRGNPWV